MKKHIEDNSGEYDQIVIKPAGWQSAKTAIIHLHGSGECGGSIDQVLKYGVPRAITSGLASTKCAVYCPHALHEKDWIPEKVRDYIYSVKQAHAKIILIGYSLGATAVLNLLEKYSIDINLAIAISGQYTGEGSNSRGAQLIAIQGEKDAWASQRLYVERSKIKGIDASYIEVPDWGHYISEVALSNSEIQKAINAIDELKIFEIKAKP